MDATAAPAPAARRGARLLALSFLDQAAAAFPRLEDPADAEALHDFRVGPAAAAELPALPTVRCWTRACRRSCGGGCASSPRPPARAATRRSRSSGCARGASTSLRTTAPASPGCSAAWTSACGRPTPSCPSSSPRSSPPWRRSCASGSRSTAPRSTSSPDAAAPRFARPRPTSSATRPRSSKPHLARIEDADDEKEAHEARISAKRLRYLLEPLLDELPAAAPLVKRLKALQDMLGELHDAHVLETELAGRGGRRGRARRRLSSDRGGAGRGPPPRRAAAGRKPACSPSPA